MQCLGNISKDFTSNNIKIININVDTNNILGINKYLMKRTWYKIMFGLIKKTFIGLVTGLVNGSNQ